MDASKKGLGSKVGHTADVIVGDIVLGSIGRAAFHVGKIPGVKAAGAYVRDNVKDGYVAAEVAEKKRKALAALVRIQKEGVAMSPETLACIARDNGLDPKALAEIAAIATKKALSDSRIPVPGDGTYSAPATAGA